MDQSSHHAIPIALQKIANAVRRQLARPVNGFLAAIVLASLSACATPATRDQLSPVARSENPTLLRHVVLISLKDSANRAELERDCKKYLSNVPGVIDLEIASPVDIGRANVDGDYNIAVFVSFESLEQYKAYLEIDNP